MVERNRISKKRRYKNRGPSLSNKRSLLLGQEERLGEKNHGLEDRPKRTLWPIGKLLPVKTAL